LRGASAIQSALTIAHDKRIRAFIVWEPVLPTDWGAPSTGVLSRVHDARAVQFWDRRWLLSQTLGGPAHQPRGDAVNDIGFRMKGVIWDFVAIYPPGSERPSLTGAPLVSVNAQVHEELAKAPPQ
jgi:hypothetical protein